MPSNVRSLLLKRSSTRKHITKKCIEIGYLLYALHRVENRKQPGQDVQTWDVCQGDDTWQQQHIRPFSKVPQMTLSVAYCRARIMWMDIAPRWKLKQHSFMPNVDATLVFIAYSAYTLNMQCCFSFQRGAKSIHMIRALQMATDNVVLRDFWKSIYIVPKQWLTEILGAAAAKSRGL